MPYVDIADASLYYELAGRAGAPVLVLSNSLGTSHEMWDAQMAEFGQQLRVLRYDTRGHGKSSAPAGPYSIAMLGHDVLGLLDHLDLLEVNFCGISLGGITALWLAIHAPRRLRKVVAANTAARIGNAEGWNERIEKVERQGVTSLVPATLERWYTEPFRIARPDVLSATTRMLETTSVAGYAGCCAAIRDIDQTDDIESIRTPTLVIAASHDPVTPPADGHFLKQKIPGARYVELNAAHLSNIEDAAAFTQSVLDFLQSGE